ncbi:MAG: hypothetical protein Q9165_008917 [Trypethelium subeluteriae]
MEDEPHERRSKYPWQWDHFVPNRPERVLSVEEFRSELHQITRNRCDDDLLEWQDTVPTRCTDFLHLGARNGVDYGTMLRHRFFASIGGDGNKHYPDDMNTPHSITVNDAFFIDELKTPEMFMRPVDELLEKPDLEKFMEIGPLITYSDEAGWNDTRFSIAKCLVDNSLWIVAVPSFWGYELDSEDTLTWHFAKPREQNDRLKVLYALLKDVEDAIAYFSSNVDDAEALRKSTGYCWQELDDRLIPILYCIIAQHTRLFECLCSWVSTKSLSLTKLKGRVKNIRTKIGKLDSRLLKKEEFALKHNIQDSWICRSAHEILILIIRVATQDPKTEPDEMSRPIERQKESLRNFITKLQEGDWKYWQAKEVSRCGVLGTEPCVASDRRKLPVQRPMQQM